jgi:hypothetical protein
MAVAESHQLIDERVRQGGSLGEVEEEIIDPAPYGEEQKAALWLYASATVPGAWRRSQPRWLSSRAHAWVGLTPLFSRPGAGR